MLKLGEEIGGDEVCLRRLVGNHDDFARPSQHVDIHQPVDGPLGGRHVDVARTDDFIHPWDRLRPVGKGGDGLGASHPVDLLNASHQGRRQDHGLRTLRLRGHTHGELFHPGHSGGDGAHEHR